ncbi:MAG TPA: alpha/beta hydrolase [Chloroflexota bacterium]|jgi:pimeloyl-ACP methyl ester carboxylesterase|nr:alpha/beta hydrolase [Chloroflexota bacterium]
MATFVLVPGAWIGGWAWRGVAEPLRAEGHEVYPLSLTGMGERVHLARPETDLQTHVTDVVNLIEYEDLRDVVLVGHSYGGEPVAGAADRIPDRLSSVVYVDGGPLPNGMSLLDTWGPEGQDLVKRRVVEEGEGWRFPLPSWEEFEQTLDASLEGLGAEERRLFRGRAVAQPLATMTQSQQLGDAAHEALPKVLIACSFSVAQVEELVRAGHPMFAALGSPQWRFLELPTGHWPMFSRPADLARLLHEVATGA